MEIIRVFIAVDIDDPLLLGRLERLKDAVVATGVPMKPVETQNLHITLRFIGETPRHRAEEIADQVLSTIKREKFDIVLRGLGAFPGPYRPRVVWVGVGEGADELTAIRDQVEDGLRRLGFRPERNRFVPHVTLARVKGSRNLPALTRLIQDMSDYEVGRMRVSSVRLKKSTLTPRGPIYETLWEVKLP